MGKTEVVITGLLGQNVRDAEGKDRGKKDAPAISASGIYLYSAGSLAAGCHC